MAKTSIEFDEFLQVVALSAAAAKEFLGAEDDPEDLGPADEKRYKQGARVWGFRRRPETAAARAARIWGVVDRPVVCRS